MLEFQLKDAKFVDNEDISTWPYIQHKHFFVFYKEDTYRDQSGFNFMTLEIIGQEVDKPLLYPENDVRIIYWGYAMFDGIRHLYLGHDKTDNHGYINYPNILHHINILEILRELEVKYCRDLD